MKKISEQQCRKTGKRRAREYVLLFFCLNLVLAGCSRQGELPEDENVSRRLGIASLAASAENEITGGASTRAGITGIPTTGAIGFFMAADATAQYTAVNNRKGTYTGTPAMWQPAASEPIWLNNAEASLAVYYPYDASQPTTGLLNLTAGPRTDTSGKERDLWSTTFRASSRTTDINLVLKQLYSRLTVTFVTDAADPYTGTASLTKVKLAGVYATSTYRPFEKTYVPTGTEIATGPLALIIGEPTAADPAITDLLLIPNAALTTDLTLTATVDGKDMALIIKKDKFANTLAIGKQYTLTVVLKPSKLQLSVLNTTDWDNSPPAFEEDVVEESGYIDIGQGFYFAKGNLIMQGTGDSRTYFFAFDQGYTSSDGEGGDYFFRNVLEPYPAVTNGNDNWQDSRDPCRKMSLNGESGWWYTPTEDQLKASLNLKCAGTYTRTNGTVVNGFYLGTSSQPASGDQDKYVFLPYGGSWRAGSLSDATTKAYYHYTNGTMDYNGTTLGWMDKYAFVGASVRCVRDK